MSGETFWIAVVIALLLYWAMIRRRKRGRRPSTLAPDGFKKIESRDRQAADLYYQTMTEMRKAISVRDYSKAARLVRENLGQIPNWIRGTKREFGTFDIPSIPALEQGGTVLAIAGDDEGLVAMKQLVRSLPELRQRIDEVDGFFEERTVATEILNAIRRHPECLQADLKKQVKFADGRSIAFLVSYLEKAKIVAREKSGRTYKLSLVARPE